MNLLESKTALVHHWFVNLAGGERVIEAIFEILNSPDVYTILSAPEGLPPALKKHPIKTSFVQNIPRSKQWYRYYAWMFPLAVELFDLRAYDLVITSDSSTTKGVITRPETCHICYCHSPMRYAWNMFAEYSDSHGRIATPLIALLMHYLRLWDYSAAARVDYFVANSLAVRNRIRKYYRREAEVIYPPCDTEKFHVGEKVDDYYLCVGRLVRYKYTHLAVDAFCQNGKRLIVVGAGPDLDLLKSKARRNIEILGRVSDDELTSLYAGCKALIFPGEEDLGIVPIEAQACGRPVIAFGKGGALETVVDGKTGLFFYEQTTDALNEAVAHLDSKIDLFDSKAIRLNAERFGKERFQQEFAKFAEKCLDEHESRYSAHRPLL